jgi:hypothetical protein
MKIGALMHDVTKTFTPQISFSIQLFPTNQFSHPSSISSTLPCPQFFFFFFSLLLIQLLPSAQREKKKTKKKKK